MNDLQEKLIEKKEIVIMDKMNKFIHQEEKYKEKYAFQNKDIFFSNNYIDYSKLDNNYITFITNLLQKTNNTIELEIRDEIGEYLEELKEIMDKKIKNKICKK